MPARQQGREVVEIHRQVLAKMRRTAERHQQLLQLAHLLHGAAHEGAVRRQIDQEPYPAHRLAIGGAKPGLGGAGAAQYEGVMQRSRVALLPVLQDLERLLHPLEGHSHLAVDLGRRYPLAEDLVDVAHQVRGVLEAAHRLEMLPGPRLVLGVPRHLLQGGIYGVIEGGVHGAVNALLQQQWLAAPVAVAGHLLLGGGIHQPDVALAGPGEPPALHEAVFTVEPLVVLQQEGVVGGELGAAHDAVWHCAKAHVEQHAEHAHAHHEGAEARIGAIHLDNIPIGQHHRQGLHRIAQGGLVQPLAVGACAERAPQGLDADDAGGRGQHPIHGDEIPIDGIEGRARLVGDGIGGFRQLAAQVVQIHQQRLTALGIDAVDGFEGEAGADQPQLALWVLPQQLLQLVAVFGAPHLIQGAEGVGPGPVEQHLPIANRLDAVKCLEPDRHTAPHLTSK